MIHEPTQPLNTLAANDSPTLFYYTAPWCAPCKRLTPIMEKVSADYDELVTMVKVNIDEVTPLSSILSVPTLHLYRKGELIDQLPTNSEGSIRDKLDQHLGQG